VGLENPQLYVSNAVTNCRIGDETIVGALPPQFKLIINYFY
jgi:hypothetical protein